MKALDGVFFLFVFNMKILFASELFRMRIDFWWILKFVISLLCESTTFSFFFFLDKCVQRGYSQRA